jgi:anaphase-promoting complex subunit 1
LSAAPITVHRSQRLLILSPDLILRIHAPWTTRLNVVCPSERPWRSISRSNGNRFTLTDRSSQSERYHLDIVPKHRLVSWALDILECLLDSSFYSLFLSVYAIAKLKESTDISAFVVTLFACFLAVNSRSPSPSPHIASELKTDTAAWQRIEFLFSEDESLSKTPYFSSSSFIPQAQRLMHHFEGTQKSNHLNVILLALHALSEELRVHIGESSLNTILVPVLCQLAYWLGRGTFIDYYLTSDTQLDTIDFDRRAFTGIREIGLAQEDPWSIFKWLISSMHATNPRVHQDELLTLDVLLYKSFPEKIPTPDKVTQGRLLLPSIDKLRDIYPLLNLRDFRSSLIEAMDQNLVNTIWLDSLPLGVAYPLKVALSVCKQQPLSSWSESICELVDRRDLVKLLRMDPRDLAQQPTYAQSSRQFEEISTVTEICQKIQSPEVLSIAQTSVDDHEVITNLIFRKDRRTQEVVKLLEYSQPGMTFWFRASPTVR